MRRLARLALAAALLALGCDGTAALVGEGSGGGGGGGGQVGTGTGGGLVGAGGGLAGAGGGRTGGGAGGGSAGAGGGSAAVVCGSAVGPPLPAGWLYTSGNQFYVSDGADGGRPWMGRGVNFDDVFLCGYNGDLTAVPDYEAAMKAQLTSLMRDWKPSFLRVQMGMVSYNVRVSWTDPATFARYKTPMTNVIKWIGDTYPGVFVLVTLRTDATMNRLCDFNNDTACLPDTPSNADPTRPTTTDPVYRALVDTFGPMKHVLLSITNEPGGNSATNADLRNVMNHGVCVMRAEEDLKGFPHHVIAVQGNSWTSSIGFYNSNKLPFDNVAYEYHSYPPVPGEYTWSNLPVFVGEYGPHIESVTPTEDWPGAATFHADVEQKRIPNLAWDLAPYSDCAPDLVSLTQSPTLTPVRWGSIVQGYLLAHDGGS